MVDVVHVVGCERSGTNYAQWILRENFKDIMVLSTYKHYEPRSIFPLLDWGVGSQKEKIEADEKIKKEVEDFVDMTSIIKSRSFPPLAFSKNFAPPKLGVRSKDVEKHVLEAIENGTMKFVINIKNPYGWHVSFTKHWAKKRFGAHMDHWINVYSKWAEFEKNYPNSTIFIKHEDALKDHSSVLKEIMEKFNLTPLADTFKRPEMRLDTTTNEINKKLFKRKEYFEKEEYKDDLIKNKREALNECNKILPKDLMERFGYEIL